jgi:hypothetical protein
MESVFNHGCLTSECLLEKTIMLTHKQNGMLTSQLLIYRNWKLRHFATMHQKSIHHIQHQNEKNFKTRQI